MKQITATASVVIDDVTPGDEDWLKDELHTCLECFQKNQAERYGVKINFTVNTLVQEAPRG